MNEDGDEARESERAGEGELDRLLAAVARGDHDAFELVYAQLSGPVAGVVWAVMRAPAQAEEVVQEVLLEIWRTAVRFDSSKGSARAWAVTIARRRAIDRIRADVARSARELRVIPGAAWWDHVGDDVQETFDRELLVRSLEKLSAPQRQVITLVFYGRHTYTEVAGMLGIPVGTAKTRVRDAVIKLRDLMRDTW